MNRIDTLKNKKSLVIYLMSGDPDLRTTEKLLHVLASEGVSLIELGVPFSDPVADGPVIQKAGERALKNGVNLRQVLALVKRARKKTSIPIVLMLYYNIIYRYGTEKFARDAVKAGVDGVIVPDLPFDEEKSFYNSSIKHGLYIIYLTAPTNSAARAMKIVEKSRGFVYYILLKGVTGARAEAAADFKQVQFLRRAGKKPVFAGFGVSTPGQAEKVIAKTDGVIIGSSFVSLVEKYSRTPGLLEKKARLFVRSFVRKVANAQKKG